MSCWFGNQLEPISPTKQCPGASNTVDCSSQVMSLFGTQLCDSCYRSYIAKCTTSTGVTVVWILQLPYMVNGREVKVPVEDIAVGCSLVPLRGAYGLPVHVWHYFPMVAMVPIDPTYIQWL